jgi:hypothetical protein
MGILDDAIREHLDLKRRQGAEEDELQRLEDEAFGPPSRPGEPDFPEVGVDAETATGEAVAVEEPPPSEPGDSIAADREPASGEAQLPVAEPEPEPAIEPDTGAHEAPIESLDTVEHHFEGAIDDGEDAAPHEPVTGEEPATGEESLGRQEPLTGEEELVEGEVTDEEDVLEETPEFLRDQPEDDELWFEQGEPKDFDF